MGRILIGNIKGPQGEAGKNFEYAKTYASVSAMNADFSGTDVAEGEYVVISAGIDDADNGRVYRKGTNSYVYVNRVNGPTGPRGATGPMPTLVNNLNTTTAGQGALDAAVGPTIDGKVTGNGGEAGDTIATFTTSDTTTDAEIIEYTDMAKITSGSPLKTLMSIMSKAVKNVRWFKKLLGTTDISAIGNGTVTNAVSTLNDAKLPVEIASSASQLDESVTNQKRMLLYFQSSANRMFASIDYQWARLQFQVVNENSIQYRAVYGGSVGTWKTLLDTRPYVKTVTVNLSAYGQASLGMASSAYVIASAISSNRTVQLMTEATSPYNYWVIVRDASGNLVTNTSISVTLLYYTAAQTQQGS